MALGSGTRLWGDTPRRVMNGPADGEVDYKKKYRNLKRKLKFLIYVSAGVGRLWVRPNAGRTSVYPCGKKDREGEMSLGPGAFTDCSWLSTHPVRYRNMSVSRRSSGRRRGNC